MPECMTPLLRVLVAIPTLGNCSSTKTSGMRAESSRAMAQPTTPPPMMTTFARSNSIAGSLSFRRCQFPRRRRSMVFVSSALVLERSFQCGHAGVVVPVGSLTRRGSDILLKDCSTCPDSLAMAKRKKILGSLYRLLEPVQKLLQVGIAIHEIDLRGIDDKQVGGRIAEEKVLVGSHDTFNVLARDARFRGRGFLRDALLQHIRFRLQVNHQIRRTQFV